MNTNIFILCCISLAFSFLYIKKQSNLLNLATENLKSIPTSIKLIDTSEPETTRIIKKKNYITINGDTNVVTYKFNKTLKDIQHIELISATIPRSTYRINETNNKIYIGGIDSNIYPATLTHGVYVNITELLLEINTKIYTEIIVPLLGGSGNYINVLVDNMSKQCMFLTNVNSNIFFNFSKTQNTCRTILGIDDNVENIYLSINPPSRSNVFLEASYLYIIDQYIDGTTVNNLTGDYYNSLLMFPTIYDFSGFYFNCTTKRINIAQQLYLDITIDNITYWDGENILNKIYVDESQPVTVYNRNYPTYRSLSEYYLKLDKITLRFISTNINDEKIPYEFNGLGYSLQIEIVTKNKELIL